MVVGGKDREVASSASAEIKRQETIHRIYDDNHGIIKLFVDDITRVYSCANFNGEDDTLSEAQVRKTDHTLNKLRLRRGLILLDVGSGYGYVAERASRTFKVKVIGLNISEEQVKSAKERYGENRRLEFRYQDWQSFDEPVDAIVSIGAFEQFGVKNYDEFFVKMRKVLRPGGLFLLHTIHFTDKLEELSHDQSGYWEFLKYAAFINRKIFPGGELPTPAQILEASSGAGFQLDNVERLEDRNGQSHYVRTLNTWASNLAGKRELVIDAVNARGEDGEQSYRNFMKYLTESAYWFDRGVIGVSQFLLRANS